MNDFFLSSCFRNVLKADEVFIHYATIDYSSLQLQHKFRLYLHIL